MSQKVFSTNRLTPENLFSATRVTTYICIYNSKRAFCHSRNAGKRVFRQAPRILSYILSRENIFPPFAFRLKQRFPNSL